jgi:type I restriction enzyme R subunit
MRRRSTLPSTSSPRNTASPRLTKSRSRRGGASIEALIKAPERIRQIAADIAEHFTRKVDPQGIKAQVVVYDKPTCVAYKTELDKHLPAEASTIVMSRARDDPAGWAQWTPDRDELERVTARFNDPADPLKIIIVTATLLTGFDAPIPYAQYLDKPLKEHTLLQAKSPAATWRRSSSTPRSSKI